MDYICKGCLRGCESYAGRCAECGAWNKIVPKADVAGIPLPAREVCGDSALLVQTPLKAVNRALGGLARAAVYLVGGAPGAGKSTLGAQIAAAFEPSVYVSAEETKEQVGQRCVRIGAPDVTVIATTDLDRVFENVERVKGGLCVVDSLQAFTKGRVSAARESIDKLCTCAKDNDTTLAIIAHVTKDEDEIAGPKTVEHAVDVVATLSVFGSSARILKARKNRYGVTQVAGWMRMGAQGLYDAGADLILPDSNMPGRVFCIDHNGLPREVQAVKAKAEGAGMTVGLSTKRVEMVCSLLGVSADDWLIRADGDSLDGDPGADLAIAVALASARESVTLPIRCVAWGELTFDGRILPAEEDNARTDSARDVELERVDAKTLDEVLETLEVL